MRRAVITVCLGVAFAVIYRVASDVDGIAHTTGNDDPVPRERMRYREPVDPDPIHPVTTAQFEGGNEAQSVEDGPEGRIGVRVIEKAGTPIPTAKVVASGVSHPVDGTGKADIPVLSSSIRVLADGFLPYYRQLDEASRHGGSIVVILETGLSFEGIVRDRDSRPVPGLRIEVRYGGTGANSGFESDDNSRHIVDGWDIESLKCVGRRSAWRRHLTTDDQGRFFLEGLSQGAHEIMTGIGWRPDGRSATLFRPELETHKVFTVSRIYVAAFLLEAQPDLAPASIQMLSKSTAGHPSLEVLYPNDKLYMPRIEALVRGVAQSEQELWVRAFSGPGFLEQPRAMEMRLRSALGDDVVAMLPIVPIEELLPSDIPTMRVRGWEEGLGTLAVESPTAELSVKRLSPTKPNVAATPVRFKHGVCRFEGLPAGEYSIRRLRYSADKTTWEDVGAAIVSAGALTEVSIGDMSESSGLSIMVLDSVGRPTDGWWVHLFQPPGISTAGSDEGVRLELYPGDVHVWVQSTGGETYLSESCTIRKGETTALVIRVPE